MPDEKAEFIDGLREFSRTLADYVSTSDGSWAIKGFIDANKNIYTISTDTKVISKILEIQLLPALQQFADSKGYKIILAEKQNWYPDMSFEQNSDSEIRFAVDIKTTYRVYKFKSWGYCNGFTLGSHGKYFKERQSTTNIQFPYGSYAAHIVLGIIYSRKQDVAQNDAEISDISKLTKITSVISDMQFFVQEKWKIASRKQGSRNTANIGSIDRISDLTSGNGPFAELGESAFDDYWINYKKSPPS